MASHSKMNVGLSLASYAMCFVIQLSLIAHDTLFRKYKPLPDPGIDLIARVTWYIALFGSWCLSISVSCGFVSLFMFLADYESSFQFCATCWVFEPAAYLIGKSSTKLVYVGCMYLSFKLFKHQSDYIPRHLSLLAIAIGFTCLFIVLITVMTHQVNFGYLKGETKGYKFCGGHLTNINVALIILADWFFLVIILYFYMRPIVEINKLESAAKKSNYYKFLTLAIIGSCSTLVFQLVIIIGDHIKLEAIDILISTVTLLLAHYYYRDMHSLYKKAKEEFPDVQTELQQKVRTDSDAIGGGTEKSDLQE